MKKIFLKQIDDEVHLDFLKFGRGEFRNKYLVESKKQKDAWNIKTGSEYANLLVRRCLEKVNGLISVKGVIVSTLKIEAPFIEKIKQFMGVKQAVVSGEIDKQQLLDLMNQYPRAFFALTFKGDSFELKIKPKAPKSAKPSTSGEKEVRADFCSLKTNDKDLVKELIFDYDDFKTIIINHTIKITSIIYPQEQNLKPEEIREKSKRKGNVLRHVVVDGKVFDEEVEFVA